MNTTELAVLTLLEFFTLLIYISAKFYDIESMLDKIAKALNVNLEGDLDE